MSTAKKWADIAAQNQALLVRALEKLAAAERARDQAIAWGINHSADLRLQLGAALLVVEAARVWTRGEIGSGQRLMDAVDTLDGKAGPEREYEWPEEGP